MVIKRIVALPGDEVVTKPPYPRSREVIPSGYVWVEGENPDGRKTYDSNSYGPISKNLIVGQARAVVWPWSQRTWIRWQDYKSAKGRVTEDKVPVENTEVYT